MLSSHIDVAFKDNTLVSSEMILTELEQLDVTEGLFVKFKKYLFLQLIRVVI